MELSLGQNKRKPIKRNKIKKRKRKNLMIINNNQNLLKSQKKSKNFLNQYLHNNFLTTLTKKEAQWPPQAYNNQSSVFDITTK